MLPEDTLLDVFRHFLAATPDIWPILVWVCQRWRRIVFASPLGLNLRLFCTHRTPVSKYIDCWPALPVVVKYGGAPNLDPPAPEDDDNIIAALKQSGRVSSISFTVTSSLLEKLSAISEPLSELEELVLLSQNGVQRTLPSTFRWGPRLRTLRSTRIAFPSLPPLLSPCQDLVDLQLYEVPSSGYFSPEAFTIALSGTPQLRSLTLHLLSFPRRRSLLGFPPPPGERIALLALTNFTYRGTSKYLDNLMARIDAAHLEDIDVILFSQPTMDASQIGGFIERLDLRMSLRRAVVTISAYAISISFTDSSVSTPLRLQISCNQLDWQLSCMAQVCDQISPSLFCVDSLEVAPAQPVGVQGDGNGGQWLDLLCSFKFSGTEYFSMNGGHAGNILCALGLANEGSTNTLSSLRRLRVSKYSIKTDGPLWDSVQSFITSRSISGRPLELDARYQCHICDVGLNWDEPKFHLRNNHGYQILCSYCGKFECTLGKSDLFCSHLESKHPEIARNDSLISKRSLTQIQLGNLVNRHSSLRAPGVVPPTPMSESTELNSPLAIARDSDSSNSGSGA